MRVGMLVTIQPVYPPAIAARDHQAPSSSVGCRGRSDHGHWRLFLRNF